MPLISTQSLTKRYGSSVTALDALTLDVEPGIIGLVGANGAGKSTLLKILSRITRPTKGRGELRPPIFERQPRDLSKPTLELNE